MTDADMDGFNMTAAQMGNLEYSILLHADGTVTFVMAGSDIPGLTWAYGRIPTEAGEVDGVVIDYYTQALNLVPTEKGFDVDYFGQHADAFCPRRAPLNKRFSARAAEKGVRRRGVPSSFDVSLNRKRRILLMKKTIALLLIALLTLSFSVSLRRFRSDEQRGSDGQSGEKLSGRE